MYCVGLTGTVASGKSTAISYFKHLDIDTLNADMIAKQLTNKGSPALTKISKHFGNAILTESGELNRRLLRSRIMNHPPDKSWLEKLLHPMIRQEIKRSIAHCRSPYCVIEIPLLYERASYPYLNSILLITADPSQQISRLVARDQCSEEEAMIMLSHQKQNDNRETLADDVVVNTGTRIELEQKLQALHMKYLYKATVL